MQERTVVAHFMVGNTYPYTTRDWVEDIKLASDHGIDAFALNVGKEDWQMERVVDCYRAAGYAKTDSPFKLFISFDMTALPARTVDDALLLRQLFISVVHHPHQLRCKGKILLSTFAGEDSRFGQDDLDSAWTFVKKLLGDVAPIHFVPALFIDPAQYHGLNFLDGCFNWNGSWPIHLTPESPRHEIHMPKLDTDKYYLCHLDGKTFMTAVSPWFFTHYGPNSWNKNWIYPGDDWLFVRRWEQVVAMRGEIDIVQLISWNDYGESHYIGPVKGAQPDSEAWVDGFSHEPWLHLTRYYAHAFKHGHYPPVIEDTIYMWARPHLKIAVTSEAVPRPRNWELADDTIWVVVFARLPATVTISSSDDRRDALTIPVQAGVAKLSHPVDPSGGMRASMERDGITVAECAPARDGFRFQENPKVYNFNAYCARSR